MWISSVYFKFSDRLAIFSHTSLQNVIDFEIEDWERVVGGEGEGERGREREIGSVCVWRGVREREESGGWGRECV